MKLPDGSKAWFVRVRTARRFKINPVSWEGWAVALVFCAVTLGIWLRIAALRPRGLHVFATAGGVAATLVAVAALIAIGLAKSVPSTQAKGDKTMPNNPVIDHFRPRPGYWFVPKMFGLGATPVTWQGWALTAGYIALLVLDVTRMPEGAPRVVIAIALTAAFTLLCIRKTDGGWGWHWGTRK